MTDEAATDIFRSIDRLGIVVRDLGTAVQHFEGLGFGPFEPEIHLTARNRTSGMHLTGSDEDAVVVSRSGHLDLALIQPMLPESVYRRFLEERGEGVHHISFHVDDLPGAVSLLERRGYRPVREHVLPGGMSGAFFRTDHIGGLLLEIIEWPAEAGGRRQKPERLPPRSIQYWRIQIGLLVRDLGRTIAHYEDIGLGPFTSAGGRTIIDRRIYGKPAGEVENDFAFLQLGNCELELVQPIRGESIQSRWLGTNGEGCNHLAFHVLDFEKEVDRLIAQGFNVISSGRFSEMPRGGYAYFDTDRIGGVQVEVLQMPDQDPG